MFFGRLSREGSTALHRIHVRFTPPSQFVNTTFLIAKNTPFCIFGETRLFAFFVIFFVRDKPFTVKRLSAMLKNFCYMFCQTIFLFLPVFLIRKFCYLNFV